jgi:hypothetical protein
VPRPLPPPPPPPSAWQPRPELPTLPGIGLPQPPSTEPPPSLRASLKGIRAFVTRNPWIWFVLGASGGTSVVTRVIDALDLATRADVRALREDVFAALDGGAVDSVARDGGAVDGFARDGGAVDSEARQGINGAAADARSSRASLERVQRLIGVDAGVER